MAIITTNHYLDCFLSNASLKDEDCTAISDWTDQDGGTGVSSDASFDNKLCTKFDVVTAGGANFAKRFLDVGTFATRVTVSFKAYFETLGTLANNDYFEIELRDTATRLAVRFASDGIYIYDGADWNEVGSDLVTQDTWQEWSFDWNITAKNVDVYLNDVLQATDVDCSYDIAGTDGETYITQKGDNTICVTYLDFIKIGADFRTAGEAWTMQEGAQLTVRTDTRWHASAPASMLGSLGAQTVTEGKIVYDGTDVRWLTYDTGSGNVPAINTAITQGAVTGTLLGVWETLTSAPTAVGAAMPTSGFIKFREVTGGAFTAGALTGIGANATAADVAGWIEIVADSASTITIPRLGEHEIRGDWFYLDNTNGSVGQTLQVPTNGGGVGTYCPGVWIETGVGTNAYEYFPSLNGATNGWSRAHIGGPLGGTDARQNFVKDVGGGVLQIGEAVDLSCTYENTPAQASTYTAIAHSSACTYAVVSNVCTVTYPTGHLLQTGHVVGVEFTDGGASALDANFTVTVLDAYRYTFALTTADTSGACVARPGLTITFTANTLGVGDMVYCDFTSGTGVSGDYEIYAVTSANVYLIKYPAISAVTGGNVTVYSRYTIRYNGASATDFMNLTAGNRVYLNFTSGSGVDGTYTIVYPTVVPVVQASTYTWAANVVTVTFATHGRKVGDSVFVDFTSGGGTPDGVYVIVSVPTANTFTFALTGSGTAGNCSVYHASFDIVANNNGADSGDVSVQMTIGNVPVSGCKTRIPNVFLREAATATRASNRVDAAQASRPEWATTSAGAIDFEYAYSTWYHNFSQPYSVKHLNIANYDGIVVSECATAIDLNETHTSMYGALDVIALTLTSNFAGGTVQNCKFQRGNKPGSSDHAISVSYCIGTIFSNVTGGIIQYARSSGYPFSASYGSNLTINNFRAINGSLALTAVNAATVNDLDYTDAYMGYGRVYSALYAVSSGAGSVDVLVDGITVGFSGTFPNVSPPAGLVYSAAGTNITFRNIGTFDNPIPCGTFRPNAYSMAYAFSTGGNNYNIRYQRIHIDNYTRTGLLNTANSDKLVSIESIFGGRYIYSAMAIFLQLNNGLNSVMRGVRPGANSVSGGASVYGSHFVDYFIGDDLGRYVLPMNEPTTETTGYFTMVSGTRKFNSAGGILMGAIGDQATWEDAYYRKGHTGFAPTEMVMSGGTYSNYTVQYQLNTGSGFGTLKNLSYCRTATAGVSGESTFTLSDATGVAVDDYIFGTGRTNIGKVTVIEGNVITSNVANSATVSGTIRFNHLPSETITPSAGFKLKYTITTLTANLTAITFIRVETTSTASAQEDNLYNLDQYTLTLTGLETGTKVAIRETGTENILGILTESGGEASYTYPDTDVSEGVDIALLAPGYLFQKIVNYVLTAANASIPVVQNIDYGYDDEATAAITFNGTTKRIICNAGTTSIDVVGVYSEWVNWALTGNNLQYLAAFSELGGNTIDSSAGTKVPVYGFLINSWRISPDEADHTLAVTGGIILVDGGGDPFVNTTGDYTVRINYQQPIQAIVVSVSTGSGLSEAQNEQLMKTLTVGKFLGLK